jgi:eukaryotic-like serine/threonine-protein kinase
MHVAASTGRMVAGRYLLQNTIGRGAMGTVWRARDTVLARDVAVKEVRLRGPMTAGSVMTEETRVLYQRTLREARTAARLNHPAVVTIFDVVEADGSPWIVMELVQARSLDEVLTEDGPLRPHQAADLGLRVLGALACAHAAGILHRDVKPSNVLLGLDSRVVLTDFGIATLEGDSGLTQAGMVMGTPGFTAPERIRGDAASPASDLWSLGATLYAAVEGRGPFDDRGNSIAILAAIANEEPPRPRSAGPLQHVIEVLLLRDPQARPDSATVSRLLAAAGTSAAQSNAGRGGAAQNGAAQNGAAQRSAAEPGAAGIGSAGTNAAAGTGAPRGAGRRAGQAPLTAPLGLAMPRPRAQTPAGEVSQLGDPRPDGQWEGPLDPWPENSRSGNPWPENPWPGGLPEPGDAQWASQIPPSDDRPAADAPAARVLAAQTLAAQGAAARALAARALAARAPAARAVAAWALAARAVAARGLATRAAAAREAGPQAPAAGEVPARAAAAHAAGPVPGRAHAAGPVAGRAHAAGPVPGRHGAPAPGLRRGLAADLAAMLPRGRRRLLVILGALAIVGAGILTGMALTSGGSGSGSPPAAAAGPAAGFTMTAPTGWQTAQHGASTKFSSPAGNVSILVTPSSADHARGLGQTRQLLAQALKQGRFPGYLAIGRRRFFFTGGAGMAWQFSWQPATGRRREVRDIAFRVAARSGGRAYLVQESAPVVAWAASQPVFKQALSTFRGGS